MILIGFSQSLNEVIHECRKLRFIRVQFCSGCWEMDFVKEIFTVGEMTWEALHLDILNQKLPETIFSDLSILLKWFS
jgi:hypothetical protein